MQKIIPCLSFKDFNAEEAARFYVSLLPDSHMGDITRSPIDTPSGKAGSVLTVEFTLGGSLYLGLNGGPSVVFNEGVSFQIPCETQAEIDRLWSALSQGGKEIGCGWLKDRWGLTWQIFPARLPQLLKGSDPQRARRAMEAMIHMVKIDLATIERAADGKGK